MDSYQVLIEIGKKKVFASAADWPGWCRSAKDEKQALQALIDYAPRFAQVVQGRAVDFQLPADASELWVVERQAGNASTDFGAPAIIFNADQTPLEQEAFERLRAILQACWQAFDQVVQSASDRELQKGPREGGRDLKTMVAHVTAADQGYLARLAWKVPKNGSDEDEVLKQTRQAILAAMEAAVKGNLPAQGPRGGKIWPLRYFIRRVAWHELDHAWEIEDRLV